MPAVLEVYLLNTDAPNADEAAERRPSILYTSYFTLYTDAPNADDAAERSPGIEDPGEVLACIK